jgi:hypothetical protein
VASVAVAIAVVNFCAEFLTVGYGIDQTFSGRRLLSDIKGWGGEDDDVF